MSQNKTQPTSASVEEFLKKIEPTAKQAEAFEILKIMTQLSGFEAKLWGPSIIGFGTYHYKYESGREGDFLRVGFSPRKTALTIYIMPGFKRFDQLMQKLGKYKTGKSCLYIKKLDDIKIEVLKELIMESLAYMKEKYPL